MPNKTSTITQRVRDVLAAAPGLLTQAEILTRVDAALEADSLPKTQIGAIAGALSNLEPAEHLIVDRSRRPHLYGRETLFKPRTPDDPRDLPLSDYVHFVLGHADGPLTKDRILGYVNDLLAQDRRPKVANDAIMTLLDNFEKSELVIVDRARRPYTYRAAL